MSEITPRPHAPRSRSPNSDANTTGLLAIVTVAERPERRGIFDCHHDGRYLCSSTAPLIDGARALIAQGHDPSARVVMRHAGSEIDALRGTLGRVAGVEVAGGVGFRPARQPSTASPMSLGEVAASPTYPLPENALSEAAE